MVSAFKTLLACCLLIFMVNLQAKTIVLCQSELLKFDSKATWADAKDFELESFVIEIEDDSRARIDIKSYRDVKCSVSSTMIICEYDGKNEGIRSTWKVNRLSGFYFNDLRSNASGLTQVRGLCRKNSSRLF